MGNRIYVTNSEALDESTFKIVDEIPSAKKIDSFSQNSIALGNEGSIHIWSAEGGVVYKNQGNVVDVICGKTTCYFVTE